MGEKYKGNCPKWARIKINYEGKKPTVRFSYPNKKHQFEGSMAGIIFITWFIFALFSFTFHGFIVFLDEDFLVPEPECVGFVEDYVKNNLTELTAKVCDGRNFFEQVNSDITDNILWEFPEWAKNNNSKDWILVLLWFSWFIVPPCLIYYPFKKSWSNVYPKWQAFQAKKKIMKFKPEDVRYDPEVGHYCEVPVFNNVILNFEATKDFSKYLKEFEIREHNFRYSRPRRKKARKQKGKYQPPKTFNEQIWYARFYLKQKPNTGKLEVLYK